MTDSVAFTRCPTNDAIVQKVAGQSYAMVRLSGSYTGSPTAVEVCVVEYGTGTIVAPYTSAAIFNGDWDIFLQVPGGQRRLQAIARFSNDHTTYSISSSSWMVGLIFVLVGQSDFHNLLSVNSNQPSPQPFTTMFIPDAETVSELGQSGRVAGQWFAPPVGNGITSITNRVVGVGSDPVGIFILSPGGTAMCAESATPAGKWWNNTTGNPANFPDEAMTPYLQSALRAACGEWIGDSNYTGAGNLKCDFHAIGILQGFGDIPNTTASNWKTGVATFYATLLGATFRAATALKMHMMTIGKFANGGPGVDYMRVASQQFVAATSGVVNAGDTYDIPVGSDEVHHSPDGSARIGRRLANSFLHDLGIEAHASAGPLVSTVARSGATITVAIDLNGHDGLALDYPSNPVTGFELSLDSFATLLPYLSAVLSGNTVVIQLTADPGAAPDVRYVVTAASATDNYIYTSNAVPSDATGLGFPLQPTLY